jgi:hypothetical protein
MGAGHGSAKLCNVLSGEQEAPWTAPVGVNVEYR